jgi:hypothetical protein
MFMAIGDANCDKAPLQVSQFEADKRIIDQLTQIYLEHSGGGNDFESYNLPWYFAANHTVHDSMEKRGKRGYLFTVGDEETPQDLTRDQINHIIARQRLASSSAARCCVGASTRPAPSCNRSQTRRSTAPPICVSLKH